MNEWKYIISLSWFFSMQKSRPKRFKPAMKQESISIHCDRRWVAKISSETYSLSIIFNIRIFIHSFAVLCISFRSLLHVLNLHSIKRGFFVLLIIEFVPCIRFTGFRKSCHLCFDTNCHDESIHTKSLSAIVLLYHWNKKKKNMQNIIGIKSFWIFAVSH